MTRHVVLTLAAWLLAFVLGALPARAVTMDGGVEVAYEYYDANQSLPDDAQARLHQTYLLNVGGDLWAPEIASYNSSLRWDVTTQSWEYVGGAFTDGIRSLSLEARAFPYSPLNLAVAANVRSTRNDAPDSLSDSATGVDEVSLSGRFWLGFPELPPTTVQVSHNASTGYRTDPGNLTTQTQDVVSDNLTVSTSFRHPTNQTSLALQMGTSEDKLRASQTLTRAASLQFSGLPLPRLQLRAGVELGGAETDRQAPSTDWSMQRQSLSARARYQLAATENVQVAVSGGRTQQLQGTTEREDYSTSLATQYSRPLSEALQGLFSAEYSRMSGGAPADPSLSTQRGRMAVRTEVSPAGPGRLSWTGAAGFEQVTDQTGASAAVVKPGATLEGRADYQLRPAVTVGGGVVLYRNVNPSEAAPTDEVNRFGVQGSVRWAEAARRGRASLSVLVVNKEYQNGGQGQDASLTASAGLSPRSDLDLSADLQLGQVATQTTSSFTGTAAFRPRSDLTLSLNLSHQLTGNTGGTRSQSVALLRSEYLLYALRLDGSLKLWQTGEPGLEPRTSFEGRLSVRRDF